MRVLLVGQSRHVRQDIENVSMHDLQRLAFLVAGTGGRTNWAPTWIGNDSNTKLDSFILQLDFALPWKLLSWQADLAGDLPGLPPGAEDPADLLEATTLHDALRELASDRLNMCVPDGVVPMALPPLLALLGAYAGDRVACVERLKHAILRAVALGVELHKSYTVNHWQSLFVPLLGVGSNKHQDVAGCYFCQQNFRKLFRIGPTNGVAASHIVKLVCQQTADADGSNIGQKTVPVLVLLPQECGRPLDSSNPGCLAAIQ